MAILSNDETILSDMTAQTKGNFNADDTDSAGLLGCASIKVGRLLNIGEEQIPTNDPLAELEWRDYVYLDTVTNLKHSVTPIYEEGGIRHLRDEHSLEIEFVFGANSYVGKHFAFLTQKPFAATITLLRDYLTRQGLVLDLHNMPTAMHHTIGANQLPPNTEGIATSGLLFDNFNGPLSTGFEVVKAIGDSQVIIKWSLKVTTNNNNLSAIFYDSQYADELSSPMQIRHVPIISGELKLDIDEDGDLMIFYGGTIHAATLAALYAARDYLQIIRTPLNLTDPLRSIHDVPEERWAQVNGFKVKKSFNVDKTGRSAKFSFAYTQIKSNSAYPIGIRDIDFDHSFSSDLLSKNILEGAAFRTWKHTFSGKIRIPSRMPANYGWFIIHTIIQQKLRTIKLSIASIGTIQKYEILTEYGVDPTDALAIANLPEEAKKKILALGPGSNLEPITQVMSALPLSYKMKHQHYRRTLTFDISFLILGSFTDMLKHTRFFDRVNNDYHEYLELLRNTGENEDIPKYKPRSLSGQWAHWELSTDPALGFNPNVPGTGRLEPRHANNNSPHRDNAGTEIVETGHHMLIQANRGEQPPQIVKLVTTVVDPQDNDPAYGSDTPSYNHPVTGLESPGGKSPGSGAQSKPFTIARTTALYPIEPEYSWIDYEQKYIIHEVNGTIPTESLASLTPEYFSSEETAKKYLPSLQKDSQGNYEDYYASSPPNSPINLASVRGSQGSDMRDRVLNPEDEDKIKRETFAASGNRFYIQVQGSALRAKYKIPIPSILRIAGRPAYRVGTGRTMMHPVNMGGEIPIYQAVWDHMYTFDGTLDGKDILASIETTGSPVLYT